VRSGEMVILSTLDTRAILRESRSQLNPGAGGGGHSLFAVLQARNRPKCLILSVVEHDRASKKVIRHSCRCFRAALPYFGAQQLRLTGNSHPSCRDAVSRGVTVFDLAAYLMIFTYSVSDALSSIFYLTNIMDVVCGREASPGNGNIGLNAMLVRSSSAILFYTRDISFLHLRWIPTCTALKKERVDLKPTRQWTF
jgi:hypothetical protein